MNTNTVGFDSESKTGLMMLITLFITAGVTPSVLELVSWCLHIVKSDGFSCHSASSL